MAAVVSASALSGEAKLSPGYYRSTCPRVESIVRSAVDRKVKETFVTVPATLRLFFHDCFVQVRAGEIERSTPWLLPSEFRFFVKRVPLPRFRHC
jgi:hypothetical protein